ncbi:MAG TPA: ABC transporter permease [archaeon]|nr:ABC transporter permease [archaeon]
MIADILTVIWKELIEIRHLHGTSRAGILVFLVPVGMFGVFFPVKMGPVWVNSPMALIFCTMMPFFMVIAFIADSFAGERERKTLETLLASRLPDRAILFGKIFSGLGFSWGVALFILVLGLVSVNLVHAREKGLLLYSPTVFLGSVALSFLGALLASGAGVLVSLRASTVRQAQQNLSIVVMLLIFLPSFGIPMLPAGWRDSLFRIFKGFDLTWIIMAVAAVFLIADILLVAAAAARFKRARLILD